MILHGFFPTEVRVAAEVRAAVAAGFEVDVIALRDEGQEPTGTAEGARYFRLPVDHVHGSGLGAMLKEYLGFTALSTVKAARLALRRRYDVVQVHNPPDFLVVAAAIPAPAGCADRLRRARPRLATCSTCASTGGPARSSPSGCCAGLERFTARVATSS